MRRIEQEMEQVERAHGLAEGEYWHVHEAPAEWQALSAEWDARDLAIRVATLRSLATMTSPR